MKLVTIKVSFKATDEEIQEVMAEERETSLHNCVKKYIREINADRRETDNSTIELMLLEYEEIVIA